MALLVQGQVGPTVNSDGAPQLLRLGKAGDVSVSLLHGRYYEQVYRGNVYSTGMSATALSANTITLSATTTPILGLFNPLTSPVNLVILKASLTWFVNTATTPQSAGSFVWAASTGNVAITTGLSPMNRKSLSATGSQAKAFNGVTALTGLTNNLVIFDGADIPSPGPLAYGAIAVTGSGNALAGALGVQDFDGGLIVPPGGVLALLNTTSTTTMSVSGRLIWEEVPV